MLRPVSNLNPLKINRRIILRHKHFLHRTDIFLVHLHPKELSVPRAVPKKCPRTKPIVENRFPRQPDTCDLAKLQRQKHLHHPQISRMMEGRLATTVALHKVALVRNSVWFSTHRKRLADLQSGSNS